MTANRSPLRVVVAGAGVAGIEAVLALRELAGDRVAITLLAPGEHFSYRPFAIARPFGLGHARTVPLSDVARRLGVERERGGLVAVDDHAGVARTAEGGAVAFDALLVAVGAQPVEVVERALTWFPDGDPEAFGGLLRDLEEGYVSSVAFVVPPGAAWPLPTYELALLTARETRGMGREVAVHVVTPEAEPLAFLGDDASAAIRDELARSGIALHTGAAPGWRPDVQRVVALPGVRGPAIEGLAADDEGFLLVGEDGRVEGARRTWAAGDGIAFPIKLGGLATQQAERAAAAIARVAGADVPELEPLALHGVLMTGTKPVALGEGTPGERAEHVPLWWPAGKVAGRRLPGFLSERDDVPEPPAGAGVPVRRRVDLRGPEASWLYDVLRPTRRG